MSMISVCICICQGVILTIQQFLYAACGDEQLQRGDDVVEGDEDTGVILDQTNFTSDEAQQVLVQKTGHRYCINIIVPLQEGKAWCIDQSENELDTKARNNIMVVKYLPNSYVLLLTVLTT